MNPDSKHRPLFFTPRSPWGGRLKNQSFRRHMRASEDGRELPEEDKDGRFQGKIESTGETHGKPENYFELQVNSNLNHQDPASQKDPFWDTRKEFDPDKAELEKRRALEHAEKAAREAQAKKTAQAAQKPKQPSKWKFTAPPASSQRVPGL